MTVVAAAPDCPVEEPVDRATEAFITLATGLAAGLIFCATFTGFPVGAADGTCALGGCDGDCITTLGVPPWLPGVGVTEGEDVIFPFGGEAFTPPVEGLPPGTGVFISAGLADPLGVNCALTGVAGGVGGSSYFCNCSK